MNIYDILIGVIIGLGLERALRLTHHLQKMIKEIKERQKAEKLRKEQLVKENK
jgi:hypothetical protein